MTPAESLLEARQRALHAEAAWLKARGREDAHQVLTSFAELPPALAQSVLLDLIRTSVVIATKARGTVRQKDRVAATRFIATMRKGLIDAETAVRNIEATPKAEVSGETTLTGEAPMAATNNQELGVETATEFLG